MQPKELYHKAWRLIETARGAASASERRALMAEAVALIKTANRLKEEAAPSAPEQLDGRYQLQLSSGDAGSTWIDLPLEGKADALWAAEALAASCAEAYDGFSLWQGKLRLLAGSTSQATFATETAVAVSARAQEVVVEWEERVLDSNQALARSQRLLRQTRQLRSAMAERP